jgi:RNA recognition motif-containing protein
MAYNADTMSFELPDTDMIYVSGLPTDITVNEVAEHFGSIGIIKFDKKKDQKKVRDVPGNFCSAS